jgi:D-alanyl-D-alanine carboxypeptidase
MNKRVLVIVFIVLLLAAAGVFWWYMRPHDTASQSAQNSTLTTKEEKKIQLALPGADPIDPLLEDYNDPTSLWVVVNKDFPLTKQDYRPTDLTLMANKSRPDKGNDERSIRAVVVADFNNLIAAANTAGYDLIIGSGFRSYNLQATYYNNLVRLYGVETANQTSAKPGQSEHQTGLTADLTLRSMECYISTCFGDTPAGKWLAANAVEYGFIIRYPADKTEITKYEYEPWHVRYVGKPLAKALQQSSLTLDEARPYLQQLRTELIDAKKITVQ